MMQAGWPETKLQVSLSIHRYWDTLDELAVLHVDRVIYQGMRIVLSILGQPQTLLNRAQLC